MSTNNTEKLGFKILTMGKEELDSRKPCNLRPITLAKLHAWIDSKTIDNRLKIELKKSAANYPQQALSTWQKMYSKHLAAAQNALEANLNPIDNEIDELYRKLNNEEISKKDDAKEIDTKENYMPTNDIDGWES